MSYKENPYKYNLVHGYAPLSEEWKRMHVSSTGHIIVEPEIIHLINHGILYGVGSYNASVSNGANIDLLITPNGNPIHTAMQIAGGGDCVLSLYEGTTYSAAGTAITPLNLNRSSSNLSDVSASVSPTITDVGTLIYQLYAAGGTGGNASGGHADFQRGILKSGETYLFRLTNTSGGTKPMQISLQFFDPLEESN